MIALLLFACTADPSAETEKNNEEVIPTTSTPGWQIGAEES